MAIKADQFAGGLGANSGAMLGFGVAAAYAATKLKGVIDEFKDARVELGKFNINLSLLEKRASAMGFKGSFKDLRNELSLTRQQSEAFFAVFSDGLMSGVISAGQLTKAASSLRDVFGGDQTDRLREYVDLLKQFPNLEKNLKITASIDEQTSSIFALAKAGKMEAVIDLQSAGLLGGKKPEKQSIEAKMLNANQKTMKWTEDIKDFLLKKMFPSWGFKFSEIVGGLVGVVLAVGGVAAMIGFLRMGLTAQVGLQQATVAAISTNSAAKTLQGGLPHAVQGGVGGGVFGLLKTGFAKLGLGATKAAQGLKALATPTAAVGAVAVVAGLGLKYVSNRYEESGKEFEAATSDMAGNMLIAGGTIAGFAALGSAIFPVVGTVVGTLVGLGVVLYTQRKSILGSM